jgi:hypothetical protein
MVRTKKEKIPKALREQVWRTLCGEVFKTKCIVVWCTNSITVFDFEVGHNIPESKGGTLALSNLRPICTQCNRSMSNHYTIDEWNKLGGTSPAPVKPQIFTRQMGPSRHSLVTNVLGQPKPTKEVVVPSPPPVPVVKPSSLCCWL